jgi:hypothetical protein
MGARSGGGGSAGMGSGYRGNYYGGNYHKNVMAAANKWYASTQKYGGSTPQTQAAYKNFQKVWNKTYGVPKTSNGKVDYNHYGSVLDDALGLGPGY